MLKMINFYCDTEKDKLLLDFLKTKTNKSSYIREVLYTQIDTTTPIEKTIPLPKKDKGFINSFANFTKVDK